MKRWEIAEEMSMNCTAYAYYVTLMAKCTCAWLHHSYKVCCCHVLIQTSQDGFMLRLICKFLGCDLPIHLLLNSLSSKYDDRLEDHFIMYGFTSQTTKYVTFYAWTIRLTLFLPTIYQYSCFFVWKLLLTTAWKQVHLNIKHWTISSTCNAHVSGPHPPRIQNILCYTRYSIA